MGLAGDVPATVKELSAELGEKVLELDSAAALGAEELDSAAALGAEEERGEEDPLQADPSAEPPAERAIELVDEAGGCRAAVEALRAQGGPIVIDLEGENLGRKGSLCILQAVALAGGPVYLFDVATLGRAAFEDGDLQKLLEDEGLAKLFYDVRADHDILYHQYGIRLASVRDLQVLCCVHENRVNGHPVERLKGLPKALLGLSLPDADKDEMGAIKATGKDMFLSEELGGHAAWSARPLDNALLRYAANDVLALKHIYLQRLDEVPDALLASISAKRMRCKEGQVQLHATVRLLGMPLDYLNGQTGTVLRQAPDAPDRWAVKMTDGAELRVHQDNLEELDACSDARRDFPLPSELRTICVGGIGPQTCRANLAAYFREFGGVTGVRFGRGESDAPFALVEFEEAAGADAALHATGHPRMGPRGASVSVDWPEHVRRFCPQYIDVAPKASGLVDQLFAGTVKSFSPTNGFGFIQSESASRLWGQDVYVHRAQLDGRAVGEQVTFTVEVNTRGQPQARGIRKLCRRCEGSVKYVHPDAGHAFLQCSETFRQFGTDVYAPPDVLGGCTAGQEVSFEVVLTPSGHLQATELDAKSAPPSPDHAQRRFKGSVKFLNLEKRWGFIISEETRAEFGEEIFVHSSQASALSGEKGQKVSFSVVLSAKGQPQAKEVQVLEASE